LRIYVNLLNVIVTITFYNTCII